MFRNACLKEVLLCPVRRGQQSHRRGCHQEQHEFRLNMIVCVVIGVAQLLIWATWGFVIKHPARFKLWSVVFGAAFAMLLEVFDFPPVWGIFDAHAISHAATLPITYLWWSFIKDDATYITRNVGEEKPGFGVQIRRDQENSEIMDPS